MSQMGPIESLMHYVSKVIEIHQKFGAEPELSIHCKQHGEIHSATSNLIDAPEFGRIVGRHFDEEHPDLVQVKIGYVTR